MKFAILKWNFEILVGVLSQSLFQIITLKNYSDLSLYFKTIKQV